MFRCFGHGVPLLLIAVFVVGCGSGGAQDRWTADRPQTVPVSGAVLYNQQPVEAARVVFVPQGHNHAAAGESDASGRFRLRTFQPGDGAVPGEYKVTVRKVEVISAPIDEDADDETPEPEERSLLPEQYRTAESTELTATVTDGGDNTFTFELTD